MVKILYEKYGIFCCHHSGFSECGLYRLTASIAPGNLLDMLSLGSQPRLSKSDTLEWDTALFFNKPSHGILMCATV